MSVTETLRPDGVMEYTDQDGHQLALVRYDLPTFTFTMFHCSAPAVCPWAEGVQTQTKAAMERVVQAIDMEVCAQ